MVRKRDKSMLFANEYQRGYAAGIERGRDLEKADRSTMDDQERESERKAVVAALQAITTIADTASHLAAVIIRERG